jgi:gamma-glutamyl phosphate reductase
MDYDFPINDTNTVPSKFDITFNATVNNKEFAINFSNERVSNHSQYLANTFMGRGEAYNQFLKEVESDPVLRNKNQYSDDTVNAANAEIGAIAQSVYLHVQSHSPDQDEE